MALVNYNLDVIQVVENKNSKKGFKLKNEAMLESGTMINSDFLNGLDSELAKKEVLNRLEKKGIGNKKINPGREIIIDSKFDHRIAMSFLCLGLLMVNGVKVKNAETINSSFPSFFNIMKSLGANLKK